jgi:uncharacterized protein (DUF2235 family)
MALYAFDGTWNENQPDDRLDTNVRKLFDAYEGPLKFYVEGPGTRRGWLGKWIGGAMGAGARERVQEGLAALARHMEQGDDVVDAIGFSRGAAIALDFANRAAALKVGGRAPRLRLLGLWDTVGSFGLPGNLVDWGWKLKLPAAVERCCHAMALDERRRMFPVTRQAPRFPEAEQAGRLHEVWFRGVHSDVGGGNGNVGLSALALGWMVAHARAVQVPVGAAIQAHTAPAHPDAPIRPERDPYKNRYRTVRREDRVHLSVRHRPGHANPPPGTAVVTDDGSVVPGGFPAP